MAILFSTLAGLRLIIMGPLCLPDLTGSTMTTTTSHLLFQDPNHTTGSYSLTLLYYSSALESGRAGTQKQELMQRP